VDVSFRFNLLNCINRLPYCFLNSMYGGISIVVKFIPERFVVRALLLPNVMSAVSVYPLHFFTFPINSFKMLNKSCPLWLRVLLEFVLMSMYVTYWDIYEPRHDKTYIMRLRPAWIQTSPSISAVWSGSMLFAISYFTCYWVCKRTA
jgi:hypothetical protein